MIKKSQPSTFRVVFARVGPLVCAAAFLLAACSDDGEAKTPACEWLFVQTADEAASANNATLTLASSTDVFGFTDRPCRNHELVSTQDFASIWDSGETFFEDPPNAVLTWNALGGQMLEREVILTDASVNDQNFIEYSYTLETGDDVPDTMFDVALFIDSEAPDCANMVVPIRCVTWKGNRPVDPGGG